MTVPSSREVTRLLKAWNLGEDDAFHQLVPLVYQELRRLAHRHMRKEGQGHILQTTALINEAYIRLQDLNQINWQNRSQFFAISAQVMRRVLVDFARSRKARKRGGGLDRITLNEEVLGTDGKNLDLLALDEVLERLSGFDARKARVVELRFYGGFSVSETAEALGISPETVMRDWKFARAWLFKEMFPQ
ncbi:MAG: sigma-70 family RNA polymerase sigma factor [Acidobacteriota bacterium]|nr:MAG: sigma-70 family RNA polymerase sigma factor [Acidobacteriota bacterium]